MSTETAPRTRRGGTALVATYGILAVVGLVLTWYFNFSAIFASDIPYLEGWFANAASSSAAVDLIVLAVAASIYMLFEGARLGWRWTWVLVVLGFVVAMAFAFPLFLALRERTLARSHAT